MEVVRTYSLSVPLPIVAIFRSLWKEDGEVCGRQVKVHRQSQVEAFDAKNDLQEHVNVSHCLYPDGNHTTTIHESGEHARQCC